jgi:hypothetical protein
MHSLEQTKHNMKMSLISPAVLGKAIDFPVELSLSSGRVFFFAFDSVAS